MINSFTVTHVINLLVIPVAHEWIHLVAVYDLNGARGKNCAVAAPYRFVLRTHHRTRLRTREIYGHFPQRSTCSAILCEFFCSRISFYDWGILKVKVRYRNIILIYYLKN